MFAKPAPTHPRRSSAPRSSSGACSPALRAHGPRDRLPRARRRHALVDRRAATTAAIRRRVWQIEQANHLSGADDLPGRDARPALVARAERARSGATIARVDLDVVFLGTSASAPTARRAPAALLIRRGGDRLLFDCGEGTQRQLLRSSVGLVDLEQIFLTHLHADHYLGLPGLLKTFSLRMRETAADDLRTRRAARARRRAAAGVRPAQLPGRARRAPRGRGGRARRVSGARLPGRPRRPGARLRARRGRAARVASTSGRPMRSASPSGRSAGRCSAARR